MQVRLHAKGSFRKIPKGVQERPIIIANIEGEEVSHAIVPRPISIGDGELLGAIRVGEMSHACPLRGGFTQYQELALSSG